MMEEITSTRKQILYLLKTEGPMTVSDLAAKLGITEMAVRRHLQTLERDNLIQSRLLRQSMGRPTNQYDLTDQAEDLFPKSYHTFTLDILRDLENAEGPSAIDNLFQRREKRLTEEYRTLFEGETLEERVRTLAELQDEKGYMVRWESREDGTFVLTEFNCPISEVACCYNQACSAEINWFRSVLSADVERVECRANGGRHCTYIIRPREAVR
jgi:predicted ArsR family transcriptional regulator